MTSGPIGGTRDETKPDLTTVAGVEAALKNAEADYKEGRKAMLIVWQKCRKHLRALLDVLRDQESAADTDRPTLKKT